MKLSLSLAQQILNGVSNTPMAGKEKKKILNEKVQLKKSIKCYRNYDWCKYKDEEMEIHIDSDREIETELEIEMIEIANFHPNTTWQKKPEA